MRRQRTVHICLALALLVCGISDALAAPSESPALSSGQMNDDLTYLRDVWANVDKSFTPEERGRFDTFVADLAGRTNKLTPAQFELEVSRALALARNGHTSSSIGRYLHFLPIKLWWFSDGLYVVRAQPDSRSLVGAKVESIGPFTPEQLLTRIAPYISGSDLRVRSLAPSYMRCIDLLQSVSAATKGGFVNLHLRMPNGRRERARLSRETAPDPDSFPAHFGVLLRAPQDLPGRWIEVLDGIPNPPEAFQARTRLATAWIGEQRNVLYLRSNVIAGGETGRYDVFRRLAEILHAEVATKRPRFVVVDLRWNDGGDLFNTIVFSQALPKLMTDEGRVYVLVSRATFSAAIATAAMLKAEGGDKVVIAGEATGDDATYWAEGLPMSLPSSKIQVRPTTWMQNWQDGCSDPTRCYWANTVFLRSPVSLAPELSSEFTFADYSAGRDALLSNVLEAAR